MQSTITAKGQMTLPKPIRDHLGVKPGDQVKLFVHPDGTVVLLPKCDVTVLRGMLKSSLPPATIEEMDDAIAEGAAEGNLRDTEE
jgi:antitoxin PrlF